MQVIDNGAAGNTVTVPVVNAQPGIFTYTVGNTTYGAILHRQLRVGQYSESSDRRRDRADLLHRPRHGFAAAGRWRGGSGIERDDCGCLR